MTWSNGQPVEKVGLGAFASTTLWVNCTANLAQIPDGTGFGQVGGPWVWRTDGNVGCTGWYNGTTKEDNAYSTCTNWTFYKHYISIKYITCAV